jgi:hypothetical protein
MMRDRMLFAQRLADGIPPADYIGYDNSEFQQKNCLWSVQAANKNRRLLFN